MAAGAAFATAQQPAGDGHTGPESQPRLSGPRAAHWFGVLSRLDRARGHAFRQGRVGLLRRVYAPGSTLERRDRAVLTAYRTRGVRLGQVRLDILVLRVTEQAPAHTTVRVVERLVATTAVLPSGERVALPGDGLTRRALHLVRTAHGWRLAGVRRLAG